MDNESRNILSSAECAALRGIAIMGIFLHNYCHWLPGMVQENEYQFFEHNVQCLDSVMSGGWNEQIPFHIISFFGHYGVPIFLFLSAYGLVLKYESNQSSPRPWSFVSYHWKKLFRMMIVGFVAFTMIDAITSGSHRYEVIDIVAQLGLLNNLLPRPDAIIWPGPYWFFGLMLQLYIIYRLLLFRRHWAWTVVLIIVCTAIQMTCNPEGEALNRWRYNFVGGMLPFGAGLLYARHMKPVGRWFHLLVLAVSLVGIWFLSRSFHTWFIVPLLVCSAGISLVKLLSEPYHITILDKLNTLFMRVAVWMGGISAALFVCHPITRKIFIGISKDGRLFVGIMLYIVTSLCLAWLFKELMKRIPSPKLK